MVSCIRMDIMMIMIMSVGKSGLVGTKSNTLNQ